MCENVLSLKVFIVLKHKKETVSFNNLQYAALNNK